MVAFAETSRPTHRAYAHQCVGSSSCAPGKNPSLGVDRNQQYSITALTNASGTITERYSYTAYGQPLFFDGSGTAISDSAESNRYTYTGREWDEELHLYHYRARMYDAMAGRFLSRDPIERIDERFLAYIFIRSQALGHLDPDGNAPVNATTVQGGVARPNEPCGLLFSWMLPNPQNRPNIPGHAASYMKCVLKEMAKGSTLGQAKNKCTQRGIRNPLKQIQGSSVRWLAASYCCEISNQNGKTKDPCEHGTPVGDPLGEPRDKECWHPIKNPTLQHPDKCFDCCDFLECQENLEKLINSTGGSFSQAIRWLRKQPRTAEACKNLCGRAGNKAK